MKKGLKITGIVLGIGALFTSGTLVGAANDWTAGVINDAYSGFLDVASNKTNDLTKNVSEDINSKLKSETESTVAAQEAELKRLLDEYYQMKLDNVGGDELKQIEGQIKQIRQNVYESYRGKIDDAFKGK